MNPVHKLYTVVCDDVIRYDVIADSEDECKALVRDYEHFDHPGSTPPLFALDYTKWNIIEVGHAERGPARVFNSMVLASEPIRKEHSAMEEAKPVTAPEKAENEGMVLDVPTTRTKASP